ncbi:unnamed protein product [Parajaminaea phylloscopi]
MAAYRANNDDESFDPNAMHSDHVINLESFLAQVTSSAPVFPSVPAPETGPNTAGLGHLFRTQLTLPDDYNFPILSDAPVSYLDTLQNHHTLPPRHPNQPQVHGGLVSAFPASGSQFAEMAPVALQPPMSGTDNHTTAAEGQWTFESLKTLGGPLDERRDSAESGASSDGRSLSLAQGQSAAVTDVHEVQSTADMNAPAAETVQPAKKFQRRQNHSCDQCRAAKRACGLRVLKGQPIQGPCDACALRGTICTTKWLQHKLGSDLPTAPPQDSSSQELGEHTVGAAATLATTTQTASTDPQGSYNAKRKRVSSHGSSDNAIAIKSERSHEGLDQGMGPGVGSADAFLRKLGLSPSSGMSKNLMEQQLSQDLVSRSFCVFLSAWEVPMGEWLGQGCSPFDGGLECVRRTMNQDFVSWAARLGMQGPAQTFVHDFARDLPRDGFQPEHLYSSLFLDTALSWLRNSTQSSAERSPAMKKRERSATAAVEQALLWAMVAHSTQFHDALEETGPHAPSTRPLRRQLASTAWRKARNSIFALTSVDSFALCSAMLIFGLTIRPSEVDGLSHDITDPEDDTAFCLREGGARAQRLVNKLNVGISSLLDESDMAGSAGPGLSSFSRSDAKAFLIGLSNASKWLGIMTTAVAPLADPGADILGGLRANEILTMPSQNAGGSGFTTVPHLYHTPAMPPAPTPSVWDKITERSSSAQGLQNTLVPILQSKKHSVELFQYFLRAGSSYKVLMYRAAAEVDEVCRAWLSRPLDADNVASLCAGIELALHVVSTWDCCFGAIEAAAIEVIPQLSPSHKTMLTYLSGHANHAILTLLDLLVAVDDQLVNMSIDPRSNFQWCSLGNIPTRLAQSRESRRTKRLHSARLILKGATHRNSLIYKRGPEGHHRGSRIPSGSTTPTDGLTNNATIKPMQHLSLSSASAYFPAPDGLIDSRPLGTWCHPYPALAVRVQAHATSTLYDELKQCCSLESSVGAAAAVSLGLDRQKRQIEVDLVESMSNLQEIRDSLVFDVSYLLKGFDLPKVDL